MSPNPSVSNEASPEPGPSSSHNDVAQEPESSNSPQPPPYAKNKPPEDPFRDQHGIAPVGYFWPTDKGMQKGLKPATATQVDLSPATTTTLADSLPPAAKLVPEGIVLNESRPPPLPTLSPAPQPLDPQPLAPQPLAPQPPGLKRGLQIPSRVSLITWGFSFPPLLAEQGVDKVRWRVFKHELEAFARMTLSQKMTVTAYHIVVGHFCGLPVGMVAGWKMQKHKEHENFVLAYQRGLFKMFEDRWNKNYFHGLGLHVRIEPPGIGRMDGMDIASSKLFRYQQKMGTSSPAAGFASEQADKKECKYEVKEGRYRMKAVRKGRIILLPYKRGDELPTQRGTTNMENRNIQSQGSTMMARVSGTDFPRLNIM